MSLWQFVQDQVLGMLWLKNLIGEGLLALGMDRAGGLFPVVQFFLFGTAKITVLLCVLIFLISYIQSFFPPERSRDILSRFRGWGAYTVAALLGTVTPFCACSSIPLFIGFTGVGLPLGVTFAFLISSPMVDLGSLVLLMSIFGVRIAVVYVVLGLLVAIFGGAVIQKLGMENHVEDIVRRARMGLAPPPEMRVSDRLAYARDQMVSTFRKVFPYILGGVAIGAVIHNWIPQSWVEAVLGSGNPFAVVLAVLLGVPMYADIFGTIPVAEALLTKGAQLGTVLSFMMAVTTLSLPSLVMLRKAVKPKLLGAFVAVCVIGILLVGWFFNGISPWLMG